MGIEIRQAVTDDFTGIWPIFNEIVSAGNTYGYTRNTSRDKAFELWMNYPRQTLVAEEDQQILGTYYIVTNHQGPGSHVCNCGYMVSPQARGKGLATLMCEHSQQLALTLGYKAMQFNFVAASNEGAVRLWNKLGFDTVGRLPRAFNHPELGFVDALVMYKWLAAAQ